MHATTCENCDTPLQGHYCHACGQTAHNPTRNLGHAIEEVFESFWHLDGRIFRTLRDLFIPGRVSRNYLAGHRVRYIPPLRLFVILSLLTFFIGKLVLHVQPEISVDTSSFGFQADRTVAAVDQRRDRLLADMATEEAEAARVPGVNVALVATRARIQGAAANRIAQLRKGPSARATIGATSANAPPSTASTGAPANAGTTATAPPSGDADMERDCEQVVRESRQAAWIPDFVGDWVKGRVFRACQNFKHMDTEGGRLFQAGLAAVPTALFLLMPAFALLLKLLYLGSGRSYLEHLVVALYSHAFLLLMLMTLFLLAALGNSGAPGWLTGLGNAAVWIAMPIYLWLTQRRVYGGGWWSNALRFLVIGSVYVVLVSLITAYAALMGISS